MLDLTSSAEEKLYLPRRLKPILLGIFLLIMGCASIYTAWGIVTQWQLGHPPHAYRWPYAFLAPPFCLGLGFYILIGALRGLPRLTVTTTAIKLESLSGTKWAKWNSLSPFLLKTRITGRFGQKVYSAVTALNGVDISDNLKDKKLLTIPNGFQDDIKTIIIDLNARRAQALGIENVAPAPIATPTPTQKASPFVITKPETKYPSLVFWLLISLMVIFCCEVHFGIYGTFQLKPQFTTLIALGAFNKIVIANTGELSRLFVAPFLNGTVLQLGCNLIALFLLGSTLEKLIGRMRLAALFILCALGSSLGLLILNAPALTSVGTAGTLFGLFVALYILSFRAPVDERQRVQTKAIVGLIPLLWPVAVATAHGGHIDYDAYIGGALSGAAYGAWLRRRLPSALSELPPSYLGWHITKIGTILIVVSFFATIVHYPKYAKMADLIDPGVMPITDEDKIAQSYFLITHYPQDPRGHLYRSMQLANNHAMLDSSNELEVALSGAQNYRYYFGRNFETAIRKQLVSALLAQDRKPAAKSVAQPICKSAHPDAAMRDALKTFRDAQLCD